MLTILTLNTLTDACVFVIIVVICLFYTIDSLFGPAVETSRFDKGL